MPEQNDFRPANLRTGHPARDTRAKQAERTESEADGAGASVWAHQKVHAPRVLWDGSPTGISVEHEVIYDEPVLTCTRSDQYHPRDRTNE